MVQLRDRFPHVDYRAVLERPQADHGLMDSPETLMRAVTSLKYLGAIDDRGTLTQVSNAPCCPVAYHDGPCVDMLLKNILQCSGTGYENFQLASIDSSR